MRINQRSKVFVTAFLVVAIALLALVAFSSPGSSIAGNDGGGVLAGKSVNIGVPAVMAQAGAVVTEGIDAAAIKGGQLAKMGGPALLIGAFLLFAYHRLGVFRYMTKRHGAGTGHEGTRPISTSSGGTARTGRFGLIWTITTMVAAFKAFTGGIRGSMPDIAFRTGINATPA